MVLYFCIVYICTVYEYEFDVPLKINVKKASLYMNYSVLIKLQWNLVETNSVVNEHLVITNIFFKVKVVILEHMVWLILFDILMLHMDCLHVHLFHELMMNFDGNAQSKAKKRKGSTCLGRPWSRFEIRVLELESIFWLNGQCCMLPGLTNWRFRDPIKFWFQIGFPSLSLSLACGCKQLNTNKASHIGRSYTLPNLPSVQNEGELHFEWSIFWPEYRNPWIDLSLSCFSDFLCFFINQNRFFFFWKLPSVMLLSIS
jgi:hypothetical protein